jgi:hypothetical protein
MLVDRNDPPEEGPFLRGTLILLILVLASGMLFGAMKGVLEREDELEEAHERALRLQSLVVSHYPESTDEQAEPEASPADVGEGDSQADPS